MSALKNAVASLRLAEAACDYAACVDIRAYIERIAPGFNPDTDTSKESLVK